MRRLLFSLALMCVIAPSQFGQSVKPAATDGGDTALKALLLSDLQTLNYKAKKLDTAVARAFAKAEIADAAWMLDQKWAKELLREAYELTFPDEAEQVGLRKKAMGAPLSPPTENEIARNHVRRRVLEIAGHSKSFVEELIQLGTGKLGRQEENSIYTSLADKAVSGGDIAKAGSHIIQSLESDPTIINAGYYILDVAAKDRTTADKLILEYIAILRSTHLSASNDGAFRAYYLLENLVFPSDQFVAARRILFKGAGSQTRIPPAGPHVVKAYVRYIIDSLSELERREPGSILKLRHYLISAWLPLQKHAPELAGDFLHLEKKSRRPGENASLPLESVAETNRINYEDRVRKALDGEQPDEITIEMAISRGDFDKARRMIEKLADGDRKSQLIEEVTAQEAISMASKDDIAEAKRLAEKLTIATLILQAYPPVLKKCAARKDQPCINYLGYRAIQQLKQPNRTTVESPKGLSTPTLNSRRLDPVLSGFSKLAKAIAPISEGLALEILEEMVVSANKSGTDTGQGYIGFETDVFRELAPKDEIRVTQAAESLKDTLRQTVALAAIYQWKAAQLSPKN